jgi:hypothetical protein
VERSATTNERNETIQDRRDKRNGPDLRMARAALSGVSQDGGDVDPKEGLSMRTNIQRSNGARKKNNDGARAPILKPFAFVEAVLLLEAKFRGCGRPTPRR